MAAYRPVDDLVTCVLTACTPVSALGTTLGNEYGWKGKRLPFYLVILHVAEKRLCNGATVIQLNSGLCESRIDADAKLLFWKKMYTNSNVVLYTLSRYAGVPSRFMAVASQYGIHSLRQTVGTWELSSLLSGSLLQRLFISRCAYFVLMLYCTFVCVCVCVCVCVLCVFYVCTLSLPSGVIK